MKPDLEAELMSRIRSGKYEFPRDAIHAMRDEGLIEKCKQAWRTLEKWTDKGWYEYGVTVDLGWFTDKAPQPHQPPESES